ncbi:MAG: hypothetical protein ABIY55_33605 [Kofleriaceae bacterium]
MIRPLALLVCAFTIFLVPGAALAKPPKVALTEIEGDTNGEIRAAVIASLDSKELALVNSKDVSRASTKIGPVADFTEKDFGKLAAALEADAIVLAKLDKSGETISLKFRLYIHNKMEKGFTISFKDPKSPKFRAALHDKMVEKITAAGTGDGEPDEDPTGKKPEDGAAVAVGKKPEDAKPAEPIKRVEPSKPTAATPPDKGDKGAHKPDKRVAVVEPAESVGTRAEVATERPHSANLIPLRVDLGLAFDQRSFSFTTTMAGNPGDTALSPAPAIVIGGEVYPFALSSHPKPALAKLGLALSYGRTLALDAPAGAGKAPVTESAFAIGLRYRLVIGQRSELSPTLTLGLGYALRQFSPDESGVTDAASKTTLEQRTPASNVSMIAPGVTFRYPVNRRFAVLATARGMVVAGAGTIQEPTSYGSATAYGLDGMLGLDVLLGKRFVARLAGELTQVHYSFNGGALTNLDGDATTKEVSALTDRSLGGSLSLGVLY